MNAHLGISLLGSTHTNISKEISSILEIIFPPPQITRIPLPSAIQFVSVEDGINQLHNIDFFGSSTLTLCFQPAENKLTVNLNIKMNNTDWEATIPALSSSTTSPISDTTLKLLTHHKKKIRYFHVDIPSCSIKILQQDRMLSVWPGLTNRCQTTKPHYPT